MKLRIAGIADDSIVDGPGLRLTVFVQGCPHRCPGCHNPQSHDFSAGTPADTEEILARIRDNFLLDGVTLSGGEPFAQAEACAEIARGARAAGLNVWCYTGYWFEDLLEGAAEWRGLLEAIDVLVDGPFVLGQRSLDLRFRGSSNQRVLDVPASLREGRAVALEGY
ncbi:MAG TPA: anaerobic ribonucleoside-triphosphate reductase activating protein [Candidatus Faecivicinus avistercoris]|nr:anaerobic ribonucleoside-triphosphate reductase activating protein [Candidatus Faecivicinus avistercoris]